MYYQCIIIIIIIIIIINNNIIIINVVLLLTGRKHGVILAWELNNDVKIVETFDFLQQQVFNVSIDPILTCFMEAQMFNVK